MNQIAIIASELLRMKDHDLAVRQRLLDDGTLFDGYNAEMESVHRENAARLREIIEQIGWPTISKVGPEASDAAWLIAQHSIGEPEFMRRCHSLMTEVADDIDPKHLAHLHDRICFFEGRPQRYGTQFDETMHPVLDAAAVNELRKQVGLEPHPLDIIVSADDETIREPSVRSDEAMQWMRRVGWRE